jgi:hypothetical protein
MNLAKIIITYEYGSSREESYILVSKARIGFRPTIHKQAP